MANACIFCGDDSRRLTDEHMPAQVARKILGLTEYIVHERVSNNQVTDTWRTPASKGVAKVLCERCNNNWVSRLDVAMERHGRLLLLGEKTKVRPNSQGVVAAWGLKTAMVLQHVEQPRSPIIPASHYRKFYELRHPPRSIVILISRFLEDPNDRSGLVLQNTSEDLGQYVQEPALVRDAVIAGAKIYAITMTVGHAVWQIFGHDTPTRIDMGIDAVACRAVERIWPIQGTFWWPPIETVIGTAQLDQLHARIRFGSSLQ